ncbi:MAG: methyltransferase domain-containing protein [Nanobdellota archaeon]
MKKEISNMKKLENADNYYKAIYKNIQGHLGKKVLDVGSGLGNIEKLLSEKKIVIAVDKSEEIVQEKGNNAIKIDVEKDELDNLDNDFDTILCINVLEHIKNDTKTILKLKNKLKQNGKLVIMVPAFNILYGKADEACKHYRRYSKKLIKGVLKKSGFRTRKIWYFNLLGLFGWAYQNYILKKSTHNSSDLRIYNKILPIFLIIEKIIPIGLSIFVIAEKGNKHQKKYK